MRPEAGEAHLHAIERRGQHASGTQHAMREARSACNGGALSMPCERLCEAGEAHHRGRQVQTVQEGVKRVDPHREH